jgi:transposase
MAGHYRPVDRDQAYLVPPSMKDWLPREHPVWFVIEVITDLAPELKAFHRRKVLGGTGRAMYDPMMLVTLVVYASWQGVRSSRQIEARCHTDVAFRIICGQDPPDHTTISRFRKITATAFVDLFSEVLLLCAREGMGQFGKVAIDGTKIAANASKSANTTLAHMRKVAQAEVDAGLAADADANTDVDAPPPPALRDRSARRERLARVRAELEAEQAALDQAAQAAADEAAEYAATVAAGTNRPGRRPRAADPVEVAKARYQAARTKQQAAVDDHEREKAKPLTQRTRTHLGHAPQPVEEAATVRRAHDALRRAEQATTTSDNPTGANPTSADAPRATKPKQAKRNRTDPDSRIMPTKDGWIQGYNAQAAVTEDHLIIGVSINNNPADTTHAIPMMQTAQAAADAIAAHTGRDNTTIGTALFDAGYNSDANLAAPGPQRLIATGKRGNQERDAATAPATGQPPDGATPRQTMQHRLRTPEGIRTYRKRGAIVEPVFGHLKDITDLRRFLTRGITSVTGELHLATATLNLFRLYNTITRAATA